jgi:hypothetical protein
VTLPIEVFVGDSRSEVDASLLSALPVATASGATSTTAAATAATTTVTRTPVTTAPATTTTATTTATAGTTVKQPVSATPITKGETVSGPAVVAPSSVTAFPAADGYVVVHWSPVPGATGYYIFQQLPTGAWAGASLAGGNAGIADTIGTTFQLAPGSYRLAVASVFDDESSVLLRTVIQTFVSRKIDNPYNRFSVDRESDLDRKISILFYKAPYAVDRIGDPDTG